MLTNVFPKCLIYRQSKRIDSSVLIKRYKQKKKRSLNLSKQSTSERALVYFDTYYKPVYKNLWPSIRVSLLSGQKYGALVNNFSNCDSCNILSKLGAHDIIEKAKHVHVEEVKHQSEKPVKYEELISSIDQKQNLDLSDDLYLKESDDSESSDDEEFVNPDLAKDSDLHEFVPVERVYTEKESLLIEESYKGVFIDNDINVDVVKDEEITLPDHLKVFTFKPGNVSDFPPPKPDPAGLLGYYMLDAASILPVIALDIKPNDKVLDLCAAPGGKSLAILQTLLPGSLTSNDIASSRLRRLTEILRWYCPDKENSLTITKHHGEEFNTPDYDKVLVDVPCNTDRHVLMEDTENNLFSVSRDNERLLLADKQKQLLVAGIKSCKPGGSIVYSTCTLSPPQNDGVIQAAIEEIWNETQIDIVIQDISCIAHKFKDTFRFYKGCRYGQLVLPSLIANFGPMYFSKIRRLK
ncbi:5-methylcytosine rRNA methyltransferase NSUN4 [Patella vulgata]|uniref:5-methylcytosine rRNA methyltransferase NSUN4 n=1 Tax=Patella vulgata TaxID=6465 RepID=UPI00217FA3BD|nr:5-methylcytosine rRNA methyltransferase NSUN4 [Patella vulgata]